MSDTSSAAAPATSQTAAQAATAQTTAAQAAAAQACCPSPMQLFTVATAFSAFLAANLTFTEIQTLSNLLFLIQNNLTAFITQKEICEGLPVIPDEND